MLNEVLWKMWYWFIKNLQTSSTGSNGFWQKERIIFCSKCFVPGFSVINSLHLISGEYKIRFIPISLPEGFVFATHALWIYKKLFKKFPFFPKYFVLWISFRNKLLLMSGNTKKSFIPITLPEGFVFSTHALWINKKKVKQKFHLFPKCFVPWFSFRNWLNLISVPISFPEDFVFPTHALWMYKRS